MKTDTRFATEWLYDLFYKIWDAETIPEDWYRGLIIKLPKKEDRTQCTNWQGVALLSVPSKIFCKIIQMRLSDAINTILRKEQAGFRAGVGCTFSPSEISLSSISSGTLRYTLISWIWKRPLTASTEMENPASLWVPRDDYQHHQMFLQFLLQCYP